MRSLHKASRTNPAHPPNHAIPLTDRRSPQSAHCHASRDASESLLPPRRMRPQPVNSIEFASCHGAHNAWLPAVQSACASLGRATSLAALPSPATTRRFCSRFTPKYQPSSHTRNPETPRNKTTPVPFSNTPAALFRARSRQAGHPHIAAPLAHPAKLTLIHSHGGTA